MYRVIFNDGSLKELYFKTKELDLHYMAYRNVCEAYLEMFKVIPKFNIISIKRIENCVLGISKKKIVLNKIKAYGV